MSQMCRSPVARAGPNRSRNTRHGPVSKVADDSDNRITHSKDEKPRSRSRNKIPKNLRYDLENSLISLCDVWFEDIKPHLIRNNIKLHMEGGEMEAAAACSSGSGDNVMIHRPGSPTQCTHVDPGAAPHRRRRSGAHYVGSSSTLPIVSKVPCLKPPAPTYRHRLTQRLELSPIQSHRQDDEDQQQTYKAKQDQQPYTIAVHINKNVKKPESQSPDAGERLHRQSKMVTSGEASKVPRICNKVVQAPKKQMLPDEKYIHELFKSTFRKATAVGLSLETSCSRTFTTHRFQKVIKKKIPHTNELRNLS